jgi:alkyl hydroperoxide reductase subunit AhpC
MIRATAGHARRGRGDPERTIRYVSVHDLSAGRNVDEVLRTLDALQSGELTPCNWKPGQQTIKVA